MWLPFLTLQPAATILPSAVLPSNGAAGGIRLCVGHPSPLEMRKVS
jgi:hypothetical protein